MAKTVLAIDAATVTGWAFAEIGQKPVCDALRFGGTHGCDEDVWFDALKFINQKLDDYQPDVVAIEAPINSSSIGGGTNPHTMGRLIGLQAVMRTVVRARRPSLAKLVHVQSARKFFIGAGNLRGAEAKARVKRRCIDIGWITEEDATYDKCDALCVWAKAAGDIDRAFAANFTLLGTTAKSNVVRLVPQSEEIF